MICLLLAASCSPAPIPTKGEINSGTVITWFNPKPWAWTSPSGFVWHDTRAEKRKEGFYASGLPSGTPGIALPNKDTLGQWIKVTMPDGRVIVTQQVDIGPTGGIMDISAPLADLLFPEHPKALESGHWKAELIGKDLPPGVSEGISR